MTSIEWLIEKLKISFGVELASLRGFFVQAKEMHKQEIMDAYKSDLYPCSNEDAEQYYQETFKND